jgi:hypothetical protein
MPQEGSFFQLFNEHAEQIVLGVQELAALMSISANLIEPALTRCRQPVALLCYPQAARSAHAGLKPLVPDSCLAEHFKQCQTCIDANPRAT